MAYSALTATLLANCIPCRGKTSPPKKKEDSGYVTKLHLTVRVQYWRSEEDMEEGMKRITNRTRQFLISSLFLEGSHCGVPTPKGSCVTSYHLLNLPPNRRALECAIFPIEK